MSIANDITITIGGEQITLRPSLRHAIRLERREGSFARLMREVAEDSLSAAHEIIGPHCPHLSPADVLDAGLSNLKFPLIAYIGRCTGIETEDAPAEGEDKGSAEGKTVTISEHLNGLYRTGTGWLGWTPAETLDSTPAEIIEAYKGRMEMLKAIFGGGEDKPKPETKAFTDDNVKSAFRALGTVIQTAAGKAE